MADPQRTGSWGDELAFAVRVAREAGALLQRSFERLEQIDYKSKRDVVTDADYASEELVLAAIRDAYPDDAIIAEESGHHESRLVLAGKRRNGRTWIVDPLDGTVNYANGIPYYCVAIAMADEDGPRVGVIHDPARDELLTATADGPACLDGKEVRASLDKELSDYVVSLAVIGRGGLSRERRIAGEIRIHRRMGSAALALAYVGAGRFDAFVQNGGLSLWDVAAAGLIAERGGARLTDLHGGPWWQPARRGPRINLVAAPPRQHGRLLEMLAAARTTVQTRRP